MRAKHLARLLAIGGTAALLASPAAAETKNVTLTGFEEVPVTVTNANGQFRALIANDDTAIEYELSYDGVANVTQSHIHIGQPNVNGGIVLFLCTNLNNGPSGTQLCPPAPATITGRLQAADVQAQTTQDVPAGDLPGVLAAIRSGLAYVNVHSQTSPSGLIRGQFSGGGSH